jgi:hypothetical protein
MNVMLYYVLYGDSMPMVLPSLSVMPLLRLGADLGLFFGPSNTVDFQHPVFERLLHLASFDWETAIVLPTGLARMPVSNIFLSQRYGTLNFTPPSSRSAHRCRSRRPRQWPFL